MMIRHPVQATPLTGLSLIEASAGTGKTWTLTGLYVRALLEEKLPVESIVVITFTRAATAELKERILTRIRDKISELEAPTFSPEEVVTTDRANDLLRLRIALASADQMMVATIHSFCQRLLNMGFGFVTEVQDVEVLNTPEQLTTQLRDDFLQGLFLRKGHNEDQEGNAQVEANLLAQWYEAQSAKLPFSRALLHPIKPSIYTGTNAYKVLKEFDKARQALRRLSLAQLEDWVSFTARQPKLKKTSFNTVAQSVAPAKAYQFFSQSKWLLADAAEIKLLQRLSWQADKMGLEKEGPQANPVYEAALAYLHALRALDSVQGWVMFEFRQYALNRIEQLKREAGVIVQDDYILRLREALVSTEQGDAFDENRAFALQEARRRYPLALVDETQDTDQAAWDILFAIYEPVGGLVAVGDPKQTIYRFRGADINAYMAARQRCTNRFELTENFRSTPELITAFNELFSAPQAFVLPGIEFARAQVGSQRAAHLIRHEKKVPAVAWHTLSEGVIGNDQHATDWIVREIQTLLQDSLRSYSGASVPVQPSDIAVLVDTARQAGVVRLALARVGIAAIEKSRESVVMSEEAGELLDILQCLIFPKHRGFVLKALATRVAGYDQRSLAKLRDDADFFAGLHERLLECSLIWQQRGAYSALLNLFGLWNTANRFKQLRLGERRWMNLLHLCELIAAQPSAYTNPASAQRWLVGLRQGAPSQVDADTLLVRMETDQSQIQILTIHTSKGLEFPIVLIPFAIPASSPKRDTQWPELAMGAVQFDFPVRAQVEERSVLESQAENARKVYVALTRAKSHCSVFLSRRLKYNAGPWLELLATYRQPGTAKASVGIEHAKAVLGPLALEFPESFSFHESQSFITDKASGIHEFDVVQTPLLPPILAAVPIRKPSWFPVSFSALAARKEVQNVRPTPEVFVRDRDAQQPFIESIQVAQNSIATSNIRWTFERGEQAGQFVHKAFEYHWLNAKNRNSTRLGESKFTAENLGQWAPGFGIRSDLSQCANWFNSVLDTPLVLPEAEQASFNLNQLNPLHAQAEFEFLMPMLGGRWRLRGFMDLVFESQGRYYVIDWKSNYLGNQATDYRSQSLALVMQSQQYDLQANLYSLAMHRWLESRPIDQFGEAYHYERHFGGVIYLFVRGMGLGDPTLGVYYQKAPLDQLLTLQQEGRLADGAAS